MELTTTMSKKYTASAEFDVAEVVLMHKPSQELYYGVLHPHAGLFDTYFNSAEATKEHEEFKKLLEKNNAQVHLVEDVLLQGVVDQKGKSIEGKDLDELRKFSRSCVRINTFQGAVLSEQEIEEQHKYLDSVFQKMHPVDLVKTILLQPNLILRKTPTNTFVTADYNVNPVMNLYFSRDQLITTKKGVVIVNMNSPQREIESKIISICLKKMGIEPVCNLKQMNTDAFLEGGDFFMLNNVALVGVGMRTNITAVKELMNADAIGANTVVVVKDEHHYQPQMHLDTYFNVIDKDLVAISESRWLAKKGDKNYLCIDVYQKIDGVYILTQQNESFSTYLTEHLNVNVICLSDEDQKNYGLNFLCIAPRKIISVAGQSEDYINKMKNNGVDVQWVNFKNLKQGWGAAHCTTQVIKRK